jgi:sporulation protein YlmC with PRC-barrel domain
VDEGLPTAYRVLERGVPVLSRDGEEIGTVDHVVAAPEQDIFHGLVIDAKRLGRRFVPAEDVASLHERGVDLRIPAAEVAALPAPGGGAPEYTEDPAESNWEHWVHRLTGRKDWHRRG